MMYRFLVRVTLILSFCLVLIIPTRVEAANNIDPYLARYLKITGPVPVVVDELGKTADFSPEQLAMGKRLFEQHCINCHVGGANLPDPAISLSLSKLKGATPARDNVNSIVAFLREPMVYDGSEPTFWCRQVPESWLPSEDVSNLAAFVLTAAQRARGWGAEDF